MKPACPSASSGRFLLVWPVLSTVVNPMGESSNSAYTTNSKQWLSRVVGIRTRLQSSFWLPSMGRSLARRYLNSGG
ncbi:uncharacterized protein EI90DRAFT_762715 [Cantharellus anzutake]|uniref:uncharacterized protein n=1 Tax=Cantharellus anzutake TaxID=1750568 RepID=UPI0019054138|nr:uncharacterized protein EI90DRAFT_762715 [Cantharellus anzutake]KAF8342574.1 hypothetical protein EI90DRAFT_762715 [Cantharellus anzutake]